MRITFDPAKRAKTLVERGLDFADAAVVFSGPRIEFEDARRDYGEQRMLCFGLLRDSLVLVGYVVRGDTRHVFTMRKCNDREKATYRERLGEG